MIYKMLIVFILLFLGAETTVYLTWRKFDKPNNISFYSQWFHKDHLKLSGSLFIAGLLICLCLYLL